MKHTLVFHIIGLSRKIQKQIGLKSKPLSLSYSQASTLLVIDSFQEVSQSQIAQNIHLEPASVVALIDELERLKLVKRQAAGGDRRKYHVVLTPNGGLKAKMIREKINTLDKLIKDQFPDEQIRNFTRVLEELNSLFEITKGGENEISGAKRHLAA